MEPLATADHLDFAPAHVIAIIVIAVIIGLMGVGIRRFLMAYADQIADLWREYGPIGLRRLMERRAMPQTPWYCLRCSSHNGRATTRCYSCGANRVEAEAPVPNADAPAGASAGRAQRNRRSG